MLLARLQNRHPACEHTREDSPTSLLKWLVHGPQAEPAALCP
jgi:hypothetical protein